MMPIKKILSCDVRNVSAKNREKKTHFIVKKYQLSEKTYRVLVV